MDTVAAGFAGKQEVRGANVRKVRMKGSSGPAKVAPVRPIDEPTITGYRLADSASHVVLTYDLVNLVAQESPRRPVGYTTHVQQDLFYDRNRGFNFSRFTGTIDLDRDVEEGWVPGWQAVNEFLSGGSSGSTGTGAAAASPSGQCLATIQIPSNIRPGDTLAPSATVTGADGKPVQGVTQQVWYINGVQASSVLWDGREARVVLQLSCQGKAQEVQAVLPAYGSGTATPVAGGTPRPSPLPGQAGGPSLPLPLPPIASGSGPGDQLGPAPPGIGGIGDLPGPSGLTETLVGVVGPGLVSILIGALAGLGGGVPVPLPEAPSGATGPEVDASRPGRRERMTLTGSTDGRTIEVERDPKTGEWTNVETGSIVDLDRWEQAQRDLARDREFSQGELDKMGRRESAFDRDMDRLVGEQKQRAEDLQQLERMAKAARERGLWDPGGVGDAAGRLDRMINDVMQGKRPDRGELDRIRTAIEGRVTGRSLSEYDGMKVRHEDTFGAAANSAAIEVGREVATGMTAEGKLSYKGIAVRVLTGVLTGGHSEMGLTPLDAIYKIKDGIDRGESGLKATSKAMAVAIIDELLSRGLTAVASKGLGKLSEMFPGATHVIGDAAQEAATAAEKAGRTRPVSAGAVKVAELSGELASKRNALTQAINITDEAEKAARIKQLYQEGGMKKLAQLEELGHITKQEAAEVNRIITKEVNGAVDKATRTAMRQFEEETGVKVKKVMIGDSGSSARGGAGRSIKTDADRTVGGMVFDDAGLDAFAHKNGMTSQEAYDELRRRFAGNQEALTDTFLREKGLSAAGVDYKTYAGMGSAAGQADSYPGGFTRMRQSAQGSATSYEMTASGELASHKTSGQALIDQEALSQAKLTPDGRLPDLTTATSRQEYGNLVNEQLSALEHGGSSVKTAAKALDRTQYVAERMGQTLDPELVQIAKEIKGSPQEMAQVLQNHGMSADEFTRRTAADVGRFANLAKALLGVKGSGG